MIEYVAYLAAQERVAARAAQALPYAPVDAEPPAIHRRWSWLRLRWLSGIHIPAPARESKPRLSSSAHRSCGLRH